MLASGGDDTSVRLWKVKANYGPQQPLDGHENEVRSLAFTPDGAILASGSVDQTIRLWSIERPEESPVIIFGLSEWVRALAISPDGAVLAAAATDGRIRLLVPDSDALAARVCEHVIRNLSEAEWVELVGSDPEYRATCRGIEPAQPSSTG
jgi:WD40 repeat protein